MLTVICAAKDCYNMATLEVLALGPMVPPGWEMGLTDRQGEPLRVVYYCSEECKEKG